MYAQTFLIVAGLTAFANAQAQEVDPPVSTLTSTQSSVLPVLPTASPFMGLDTIQGAIIDKGPTNPGFVGPGGYASIQNNNPTATYMATLPTAQYNPATGTTITGTISGAANSNGTGVNFMVNFSGFPDEAQYGPFVYHIHGMPVPSNGDCTATMAHLDPTNRGEYYPCNVVDPASCQAGDLAGKHGKITGTSFTANYLDLYLSTDPSSAYFFGDKSIVVHASNTTRLTCANFVMSNSNSTTSSGAGLGSASSTGTSSGGSGSGSGTSPSQFGTNSAAVKDLGIAFMALTAAGLIAVLI